LRACDGWVIECFNKCRAIQDLDLDLDHLRHLWQTALALPEPSGRQVWLHGDLRPTNLLARHGKLYAVIDFGSLSVGFPDAEHAPLWDLPPRARQAYWDVMSLDDMTWLRARAWAIAVGSAVSRTTGKPIPPSSANACRVWPPSWRRRAAECTPLSLVVTGLLPAPFGHPSLILHGDHLLARGH
jgi:hypothetical protein